MPTKLKSLQEAAACVKNGARVVMSANLHRPPMAFLREVVRRKVRDLRVIGVVGGDLNIDFSSARARWRWSTRAASRWANSRAPVRTSRATSPPGRVRSLDNT